ncbi:3913_t:CDS:2 [Entrophospora sp. SA101]|nr:3913_t:CDS:2 [Entrophospora sp. SA101]CAJ0855879.1 17295_t:CDS:2 [Entrophospora sp. SA101]
MPKSQDYIDQHYPLQQRSAIKKLDLQNKFLEGNLDLTTFYNLEELNCSNNNIAKLKLPSCKIRCLDCSHNNLTDLNLNVISTTELTYLRISNNNLSQRYLSMFSNFVNLEVLIIGSDINTKHNNFIGSLQPLQHLSHLRELDISNTNIDSGLDYLPTSLQLGEKKTRQVGTQTKNTGTEIMEEENQQEAQVEVLSNKGKKILAEIKKCQQGVDYNFSWEENKQRRREEDEARKKADKKEYEERKKRGEVPENDNRFGVNNPKGKEIICSYCKKTISSGEDKFIGRANMDKNEKKENGIKIKISKLKEEITNTINSEKKNQLEKEIKKLESQLENKNNYSNQISSNDNKDSSGYLQIVVKNQELIAELKGKKRGDLLKISGQVKKKTGSDKEIELELSQWQLINQSKELPFEIKDEVNINEDTRYRYRYLDLRRPQSKNLLLIKDQFLYEIRNFLHKQKFVDIETPILAQSSPEGANCFLVPSNLKNRYYTLPQSAQIFKQLLMVSSFDKYYQIAKSFRNEDARSNRQIEFSQLELEMSFVTFPEIKRFIEKLLKNVLKKVFGYQIKTPFPTLTCHQVMKKYGTDKPDLRKNPKNEQELKKYIQPLLTNKIKPEQVICEAFDLVCNGEELLSGSIRIYQRELQEKVLEILGYSQAKQEKNFGYFLQALEFAAPPHGGVGLGIDRLLAVILNTNSLKELIAFPKNIDGTCSLTGAPNLLN